MTTHLRKVRPGEPVEIPAQTWNTFVDAARDYLDRRQTVGAAGRTLPAPGGVVLVRNASGAARSRFDVLGLDQPVFLPADLHAFKHYPAFSGVVPTVTDHVGRFVVLLEPVDDGKYGRACLVGMCPVRIDVLDTSHGFADVKDASHVLASGQSGAAQILWVDGAGTGVYWALVRLGVPYPQAAIEGSAGMVHQLREYAGTVLPTWQYAQMHD